MNLDCKETIKQIVSGNTDISHVREHLHSCHACNSFVRDMAKLTDPEVKTQIHVPNASLDAAILSFARNEEPKLMDSEVKTQTHVPNASLDTAILSFARNEEPKLMDGKIEMRKYHPSTQLDTAIQAFASCGKESSKLMDAVVKLQNHIPAERLDTSVLNFAHCHDAKLANPEFKPFAFQPARKLDKAILRTAHASSYFASIRRGLKHAVRIELPIAATFAVCAILYFQNLNQKQTEALALPTESTMTGDWTGSKMDEQIAEITFGIDASMENMSMDADDLLLAQIEEDFARYVSQ